MDRQTLRTKVAPIVGGLFAVATALWFVWSLVLILQFRAQYPRFARTSLPIPLWPAINAAILAAVGVGALRRKLRAQGFLLGSGVLTMIFSAQQITANKWAVVPVVLGLGMVASALAWQTDEV